MFFSVRVVSAKNFDFHAHATNSISKLECPAIILEGLLDRDLKFSPGPLFSFAH